MKIAQESLKEARFIKEIGDKFPEFEHRPDHPGNEVQCVVCQTTFNYSAELAQIIIWIASSGT